MAKKAITRDNTVETFLKAYGADEVSQKAKELFVERLAGVAEIISERAIAEARLESASRVRVDADHLARAFDALSGSSSSPGELDPAGILAQLHKLPPQKIATLVKLLRAWLAAQTHTT